MSENVSPDEIRKRLVEIDDEVRLLPDDDFRGKHRLRSEGDILRRQLSEIAGDEVVSTLGGWADRAARKGAHSTDYGLERGKATIISPIEGGGGDGSC